MEEKNIRMANEKQVQLCNRVIKEKKYDLKGKPEALTGFQIGCVLDLLLSKDDKLPTVDKDGKELDAELLKRKQEVVDRFLVKNPDKQIGPSEKQIKYCADCVEKNGFAFREGIDVKALKSNQISQVIDVALGKKENAYVLEKLIIKVEAEQPADGEELVFPEI